MIIGVPYIPGDKYKIYLFVNVEIVNIDSVVERYMKVWKKMKKNTAIEGFILGPELVHQIDEVYYFSSIAEIPIQYLSKAISIISSNPSKHIIFLSSRENLLSESFNEELFRIAFKNTKPYDELNYF